MTICPPSIFYCAFASILTRGAEDDHALCSFALCEDDLFLPLIMSLYPHRVMRSPTCVENHITIFAAAWPRETEAHAYIETKCIMNYANECATLLAEQAARVFSKHRDKQKHR